MFRMRFDMRAPSTGAPASDLYRAALDMVAWGEAHGAHSTVVSEHHGSPDGYLPSPIVMASALAARTSTLPIMVSVVQLPLYNPIRLAEEMSVLDHISNGRVAYVAALGYLPSEYEMHGVEWSKRGALADEKLGLLLKAVKGEPFEHEGRRIHVTPAPLTKGGPRLFLGGGSAPAARRAGRHGLGFIAEKGDPALREIYEAACREAGHEVGMCLIPQGEDAAVIFVADDVDAAWAELGPYLMHDVLSYAKWHEHKEASFVVSSAKSAEELRAQNRSHRILTPAEATERVRSGKYLPVHPLIGGLPPDIAWKYLKTAAAAVEAAKA